MITNTTDQKSPWMRGLWNAGALAVVAISGCAKSVPPEPAAKTEPPAVAPASATTPKEAPPLAAADAEGFHPLKLADFEPFQADGTTWSENAGQIVTTGKPKGYLFSRRSFKNFTWKAEYRFVPAAEADKADQSNTGFMLCIQEPHKVWPRSLEVQGKFVEMGQIKSNGGVPPLKINDDQAAREAARKPVGEWNTLEITIKEGTVSSVLNGQAICLSEPGEAVEGKIGLQAENFPVEFRNLKIRPE